MPLCAKHARNMLKHASYTYTMKQEVVVTRVGSKDDAIAFLLSEYCRFFFLGDAQYLQIIRHHLKLVAHLMRSSALHHAMSLHCFESLLDTANRC